MRVDHLIGNADISVLRLDHQPETGHRDSEEEVCSNHALNFVEAGSFGLGTEQNNWTLSSGHVFISRRGTVHRYTHHEKAPSDVCLSVIYAGRFAEEIDRAGL